MKILVTGASGYIGNSLAHKLASLGNKVHALVRSDTAKKILQHPNIIIFKGDILDKKSIALAIKDCQQVYHTAAKVGVWCKNTSEFYEVNVAGTRNVLDTAIIAGVEKIVFTSTGGIIGPSLKEPMTENDPRITGFVLDYELSKKMSEDLAIEYAKKQIPVVIVCPTKVYGPGNTAHALTANAIINKFLKNKRAFIPSPGTNKVCMAYIDDVVNGHLLAMQNGKSGEKYILGGTNISYYDFFDRIRNLSSFKGKIITLPKSIIKAWAFLQWLKYKTTNKTPILTIQTASTIFSNYIFSSQKAINDLGYTTTSLDKALQNTIHF